MTWVHSQCRHEPSPEQATVRHFGRGDSPLRRTRRRGTAAVSVRATLNCGRVFSDARESNQFGMTLIEMIIGISMLAIITAPLTTAAIMFAQHGADVDKSLTDDGSIRSLASLWVTDAQTATSATLNDTAPCGAKGAAVATLAWTTSGVSYTASWYSEMVGTDLTLVRRRCANGSLVGYQRVATIASAPTATCAPTCAQPTSFSLVGTATNGATFSLVGNRRSS